LLASAGNDTSPPQGTVTNADHNIYSGHRNGAGISAEHNIHAGHKAGVNAPYCYDVHRAVTRSVAARASAKPPVRCFLTR
jgi:hypothetical protein